MLALFDLDETLIAGDSAKEWINFCVERKLVDVRFLAQLAGYEQQYKNATINMLEFMEFFLSSIRGMSETEVSKLVSDFVLQKSPQSSTHKQPRFLPHTQTIGRFSSRQPLIFLLFQLQIF